MTYTEFKMIREVMGKDAKKICIITDQFPPYPADITVMRGGVDIGLEQLALEFIDHDIEVLVISQHYVEPLASGDRDYVRRVKRYVPYSIEKDKIKNGVRFVLNESFNPLTYLKIKKILKEERPEAVLIGGTRQFSMAPMFATLSLKIPLHIRYDWLCPVYPKTEPCFIKERIGNCGACMEGLLNTEMNKFIKVTFGIFTSLIYLAKVRLWNKATSILPVNNFYSNLYHKLDIMPENTHVIPTSRKIVKVPLTDKKLLELRERTKIIMLYVGRLSPEKGILMLLDCFEKIDMKKHGVKFLIAGDGILKEDVEKIIENNSEISYLGWQTKEQLSELYQVSDAIIIPSTVPEGHPRSAVEAMTFDKVIIGFDIGGLQEIFEKYENSRPVKEVSKEELLKEIFKYLNGGE